jgi:hypothetical protein
MSSQSGITPSADVVAAAHAFVSSKDRAIVLSINAQSLTVDITNTISGTADLNKDLDSIISDQLNDIDCYYILLKYDDNQKVAFISYVPDNAIVKHKMLYASTKNTLLRSLGNGISLQPILFINSSGELTSDGWKKIIQNLNSDIPLTKSEISLKNVREKEFNQSFKNHPTRKLVSDSTPNLLFKLDDELDSILSSGNNNLNNLLSLKISNECLILAKLSSNMTLGSLIPELSKFENSPSFHLYTNEESLNFFLLVCPSGSKVRDRMVYASNKQGLLNYLKSNGWGFEKIIEIGDPNELELSELKREKVTSIDDETKSIPNPATSNNSLKFAKPKGPRRR